MRKSVHVMDETQMAALAQAMALKARAGDLYTLTGPLGAGKTTFARAFIQALAGSETEVTSPTFPLLQTYETNKGVTLWHYDLYRLRHSGELRELAIEEALRGGITLMEWPDIAGPMLDSAAGRTDLILAFGENDATRLLEIVSDKDNPEIQIPFPTSIQDHA